MRENEPQHEYRYKVQTHRSHKSRCPHEQTSCEHMPLGRFFSCQKHGCAEKDCGEKRFRHTHDRIQEYKRIKHIECRSSETYPWIAKPSAKQIDENRRKSDEEKLSELHCHITAEDSDKNCYKKRISGGTERTRIMARLEKRMPEYKVFARIRIVDTPGERSSGHSLRIRIVRERIKRYGIQAKNDEYGENVAREARVTFRYHIGRRHGRDEYSPKNGLGHFAYDDYTARQYEMRTLQQRDQSFSRPGAATARQ